MNNNLPDDCQGNDPRFPWNEPEAPECPACNDTMSSEDGDLVCDNEECPHVIYAPDEDDF